MSAVLPMVIRPKILLVDDGDDHRGLLIRYSSVLDTPYLPAAAAILPKPFTGAQVRRVLRDHVPSWSGQ